MTGVQTCALPIYAQSKRFNAIHVILSTAFGCPFEGKMAREKVAALASELFELGANEVVLADTTGMATPAAVMELLDIVGQEISSDRLSVHFHDTRGMGLANVLSALQCGITTVEGSVGGLGGCPFAPGAPGNIATENLVHMCETKGIGTGVNHQKLVECAELARQMVHREPARR